MSNRLAARLFNGASAGVFRGMATLALGSGIGRLIGIGTIPVLTRLYTPEDFGVLAVFTALVAILAPLVTLRYALALPLPRYDGQAMNLLVLSIWLMLGLSTVIAAILWMWGAMLLSLLSMEVLAPWWWVIALAVLGTALYELLTMWATRRRAYRVIGQTSVTQSMGGALVKIGFGLAGVQPLGLLVGQVMAQAGGILRLLRGFGAEFRANWRHVSLTRVRMVALRYKGLPTWRLPSQFLMVFSIQAPILAFSMLYDSSTVGQLGLSLTAVAVPIAVLGGTTSQAYFAEISRISLREPQSLYELTISTLKTMLAISLVPSLLLFVFGTPVFTLLLGAAWAEAGRYAEILSVYLMVQFVSNPISKIYSVLRMEWAYFLINAQRIILTTGGFLASGLYDHNAETALILFVSLTSLHRLIVLCLTILTLQKRIEPPATLQE